MKRHKNFSKLMRFSGKASFYLHGQHRFTGFNNFFWTLADIHVNTFNASQKITDKVK